MHKLTSFAPYVSSGVNCECLCGCWNRLPSSRTSSRELVFKNLFISWICFSFLLPKLLRKLRQEDFEISLSNIVGGVGDSQHDFSSVGNV